MVFELKSLFACRLSGDKAAWKCGVDPPESEVVLIRRVLTGMRDTIGDFRTDPGKESISPRSNILSS